MNTYTFLLNDNTSYTVITNELRTARFIIMGKLGYDVMDKVVFINVLELPKKRGYEWDAKIKK
jgi:hypothetical protein